MPASVSYAFLSSQADGPSARALAMLRIENVGGATTWTLKTRADSGAAIYLTALAFSTRKPLSVAHGFRQDRGQVRVLGYDGAGIRFAGAGEAAQRFGGGEQISWEFKDTVWSDFSALGARVDAPRGAQASRASALAPVGRWTMLLVGLALIGARARRRPRRFE